MAIKIDLRVPPCKPVHDVARFVSRCEVAGFDGVGILDSQMLERDVFVSMAMAAQATSRIRICSAVLNPVTRHVSVMASAIKTVSETAPGRAEFWIGRGFSSVQTIGVRLATVSDMRYRNYRIMTCTRARAISSRSGARLERRAVRTTQSGSASPTAGSVPRQRVLVPAPLAR